jgi:predicted DNA-binding transcriptional regulator YafY
VSLNKRQWDILCKLQSSDKPLSGRQIAQMVAKNNKNATSRSFREMIARDLRDLSKITGAIDTKKVLSENDEGNGYRENVYSWKANSSALLTNSLTNAQVVALGVLQKVGLGLVPNALVEELKPLFMAIHKNEIVKNLPEKDINKNITKNSVLVAEERWLNKIAFLSETVGFMPQHTSNEVEKVVHEALFHENLIEVRYRDDVSVVKPLALVQRGVRRYLIGLKGRGENDPVFFNLSRIKKATEVHVLNYHDFKGGEDFDLHTFLKKGLAYPVFDKDELGKEIILKLWVDKGTYGWLSETPLSMNQSAVEVEDGFEVVVTTTLREELVYWVLSMANHVKVLEPQLLKDRIAKDLKKSLALYK